MIVLLLERGQREGAGEKEEGYCVFYFMHGSYSEHVKEIW